jgi:plastocyanin
MIIKRLLPLTLLLLGLTGCAPTTAVSVDGPSSAYRFHAEPARDGLPEVRIVAREFEFTPMTVRVRANQPFTLVLDNSEGVVEHDVDVPALSGLHIHAMARSETRATLTITATPGQYVFGCTLPGHRAAGMRGSIIVTAS